MDDGVELVAAFGGYEWGGDSDRRRVRNCIGLRAVDEFAVGEDEGAVDIAPGVNLRVDLGGPQQKGNNGDE